MFPLFFSWISIEDVLLAIRVELFVTVCVCVCVLLISLLLYGYFLIDTILLSVNTKLRDTPLCLSSFAWPVLFRYIFLEAWAREFENISIISLSSPLGAMGDRTFSLIFFNTLVRPWIRPFARVWASSIRPGGVRRQVGENNGSFDDFSSREISRAETRLGGTDSPRFVSEKIRRQPDPSSGGVRRSRALLTLNSVSSPSLGESFPPIPHWQRDQVSSSNAITDERNSFGMYEMTRTKWSMRLTISVTANY